jgi:IS5 family transposase
MVPSRLDLESKHDSICADSSSAGARFQDLLNHAGFESLIHEKGARNHLLGSAVKGLSRANAAHQSMRRACLRLHDSFREVP